MDRISPKAVAATIAAEDACFYTYSGAIARAIVQNISGGRVVSGASTITMQINN